MRKSCICFYYILLKLGGPDGELGAALRYLSQRYAMPYGEVSGILTDVGTEELGHVEMISTIVYQLTRNLTPEEIKRSGFDTYFVDHTTGIYPIAASGQPFTASFFQSTGDVITDLTEDLAAEQKARTTYDNILRLADDYDVRDAIRFLRQRELVHFQRFGEAFRTEKFFCQKNRTSPHDGLHHTGTVSYLLGLRFFRNGCTSPAYRKESDFFR